MKRAALLVLALTAALVVVPGTAAFACSCASPPVADLVARAHVVLLGTVGEPRGDATVATYPVEVAVAYKGTPRQAAEVRSPRDSASCGLDVVPGRKYVLFATDRGGVLEARLCGGTAPASPALESQVVDVTGVGRSTVRTTATARGSEAPDTGATPPAAAGGAAAAVVAPGAAGRTSTPVLVGLGVLVVVLAVVGGLVARRSRA